MTADNIQRSYRAPCPGCGAPVDFLSAQSTHAICAYCRSMVVRSGEVLARIGTMAELFDDHSPLQLQTSGTWNGQAFTLIGRLQYQYGEGTWTEWHALLADGSSAYLSEDNGAYVFAVPQATPSDLPDAQTWQLGTSRAINGKTYAVASKQQVALLAAQGELPHLPAIGHPFSIVELRSQSAAAGSTPEVLSIDYASTPPAMSVGQAVRLEDLKLSGLREASTKAETGRQFNCPHCGANIHLQLAKTLSVTCSSCKTLVDVSKGLEGRLEYDTQHQQVEPVIPLGSTGTLQGVVWQVVGFQRRMGVTPADVDEGGDSFHWDEYLLFNQRRGFVFLVDSSEGWSLVNPATGAPVVDSMGNSATYLGTRYNLKESYEAVTNYVVGEFYWRVDRGQRTTNRDYQSLREILSSEQADAELVWSIGSRVSSDTVAQAFKLQGKKELLQRSDAKPFAASADFWMTPGFWMFVVVTLIMLSASTCSNDCDPQVQDCSSTASSRTSSGSYGGFSTGGGHK